MLGLSVLSVRREAVSASFELRVLRAYPLARRALSGRSRSSSSFLGRDLERVFFKEGSTVVGAVVARWRSSSERLERADRREEEVLRLRLRWLDRASISSMAANSGDTGRSAGVGALECDVGRFDAEGSNSGIMALSVGARGGSSSLGAAGSG